MSKELVSSQILQSLSTAITEVAEKVAPSVVSVGDGRGVGSGVVWREDGYIVTCSHVIRERSTVSVGLGEGRTVEARVIGRDPYSDVAVLKADGVPLKPVELGDPESLQVGSFVLAVANPFGRRPSATSGIVTSPRSSIRGWWGAMLENVIVTDARLNPGYSGGPLIDAAGQMIGLNTAYISSRGIAVPVTKVKGIVEKLIRDGRIRRAYLGVVSQTVDLPPDIATEPRINQDEGLILISVEPESPAKQAGLALGDTLLRFGDKPVKTLSDLHVVLTEDAIGKPVNLSILRGGKLVELTITPGERT